MCIRGSEDRQQLIAPHYIFSLDSFNILSYGALVEQLLDTHEYKVPVSHILEAGGYSAN